MITPVRAMSAVRTRPVLIATAFGGVEMGRTNPRLALTAIDSPAISAVVA